MNWKEVYDKLSTQNFIILSMLGSVSFFVMDSRFTLGIILGGIISIGNFYILQETIARLFSTEPDLRNKKKIMIKFYFRLVILSIIIYIVITIGFVDLVGFAIGLSIILLSIFGLGIGAVRRISSGRNR
ncbi:MAG: ATP synthase subunit I [Deltaproteobacteria bacterium]|nr:ATP synthase subunit I [Deltaproteobacteria bacterium]